jgi:hypothetical protein
MPRLFISEFSSVAAAPTDGRFMQAALAPAVATQVIDYDASASLQSAVFDPATRLVRLHVDGAAHIDFGPSPTATTNSMRMAADATEYFGVLPGQRLAVRGA